MILLVLGLATFLGVHSIRIVADERRAALRERLGEKKYKGIYSLVSAVGLLLIVLGYPATRGADAAVLYLPPAWTRHLAWLLTLIAFILLACSNIKGTKIKQAVKHPMLAGVKCWAIAHLITNGRLGDVLLFGSILLWAVLDFRSARRRDRANNTTYPAKSATRDVLAVLVGAVTWFVFARFLHAPLIGVYPLM